jgi:hypothetical protein
MRIGEMSLEAAFFQPLGLECSAIPSLYSNDRYMCAPFSLSAQAWKRHTGGARREVRGPVWQKGQIHHL